MKGKALAASVGMIATVIIGFAPTVSAIPCTSGNSAPLLQGFWESPVNVPFDEGRLTRSWTCSSGVMTGTATYVSAVGSWVCTESFNTITNVWSSGTGGAQQLAIFQGSTAGSGGVCVGFTWSGNVIHFSSGSLSPDNVIYIARCQIGILC